MFRAIVDWEPDVIHVNGIWSFHIYAAYRAAHALRIPYVIAPHGSLAPTALAFSLSKKAVAGWLYHNRCLRKAVLMLASTANEAQEFCAFGLTQRTEIVANGIDTDGLVTSAAGHRSQRNVILSLGRLHRIKGLDLLIRAWAEVEGDFPDWELVIAGPDSYGHLAELQALVAKFCLARVSFPGAVYTDVKFKLYADAAIFILPSRADNFALTVVEALMAETPVLAAQTTPWQTLEDKGCGWWVPLDDLKDALVAAMSLPAADRAAMGRRGRAWAESEYTWPRVAERLRTLYAGLIDGASR